MIYYNETVQYLFKEPCYACGHFHSEVKKLFGNGATDLAYRYDLDKWVPIYELPTNIPQVSKCS